MTITEFLEARITEDEAHADAARLWVANGPEPRFPWFGSHGEVTGKRFGTASPHIAAMSPARVYAECTAKRAILQDFGFQVQMRTLQALAAVYKDHPDYRQEWAL